MSGRIGKDIQIKRVLKEAQQENAAGETVDDSALMSQHQHLMPDLGEQLRTLRYIEKAADAAEQRSLSSQATQAFETRIRRELELLNADLPNYELIEPLHRGGQGILYKAVQLSTNRMVVVKILLHGILATDQQLRRFEQEVMLVGRLRHPNIVTLYDSGMACGYPYYVMELIDGLPIDDYVFLQRLSLCKRVELFITVCRAVSYAHQQGVIHRDLKPPNILVSRDGQPRVLDFGLAKDTFGEGKPPISLSEQIVGTLPYLSPEQAALKPSQVSVLSDIYTLGVILFQILSEAFPYPVAGTPEAVRENIIHKQPARLRDVMDDEDLDRTFRPNELSRDLESIVYKALAKDPAERYQSAASFADDLERYLSGEPVEAMLKNRLYVARKWLWRHKWPVSVAATFAATVVTLLVAWNVSLIRTTRAAQAGLQMAGNLLLASSYRDAGRVNEAEEVFLRSVQLGDELPDHDRTITRMLYESHHRLAEMYNLHGRHDEARAHCAEAVELADRLSGFEQNDLLLKMMAKSYHLRGRIAKADRDYDAAAKYLDRAIAIKLQLVERRPDVASLAENLAAGLAMRGSVLRKLKLSAESLADYDRAYVIRKSIALVDPEAADPIINLVQCEIKLAAWNLDWKTDPTNQEARRWLSLATSRIDQLRDSGLGSARSGALDLLEAAVAKSAKVLHRRNQSSSKSMSPGSSSPSSSGVDLPTSVNE